MSINEDIKLDLKRHPYTVHLAGRLIHFSNYGAAICHLADSDITDPAGATLTYGPKQTVIDWYADAEAVRKQRRRYAQKLGPPPELDPPDVVLP